MIAHPSIYRTYSGSYITDSDLTNSIVKKFQYRTLDIADNAMMDVLIDLYKANIISGDSYVSMFSSVPQLSNVPDRESVKEEKPEQKKEDPKFPRLLKKFLDSLGDPSVIEKLSKAFIQKDIVLPKIEYHRNEEGDLPILEIIGKNGKDDVMLNAELSEELIEMLSDYNGYIEKKEAKTKAKTSCPIRYKVGDILVLKSKIKDGSKKTIKKFIVKKTIWSIKANPVNILILKQIEGQINNMSLTKNDCKKYHIKYEENLQVYSMFMNFIKIKK